MHAWSMKLFIGYSSTSGNLHDLYYLWVSLLWPVAILCNCAFGCHSFLILVIKLSCKGVWAVSMWTFVWSSIFVRTRCDERVAGVKFMSRLVWHPSCDITMGAGPMVILVIGHDTGGCGAVPGCRRDCNYLCIWKYKEREQNTICCSGRGRLRLVCFIDFSAISFLGMMSSVYCICCTAQPSSVSDFQYDFYNFHSFPTFLLAGEKPPWTPGLSGRAWSQENIVYH